MEYKKNLCSTGLEALTLPATVSVTLYPSLATKSGLAPVKQLFNSYSATVYWHIPSSLFPPLILRAFLLVYFHITVTESDSITNPIAILYFDIL